MKILRWQLGQTAGSTVSNGRHHRLELRRTIQSQYLHHLVRVDQLAGNQDPRYTGQFRLRSSDATYTSWLASTRAMVALAESCREAFIGLGLVEPALSELGSRLAEFERTMERGRAARVQRMHARVSLPMGTS